MNIICREIVKEGQIRYFSGFKLNEDDLKSILYQDVRFLQAVWNTEDVEMVYSYLISQIENLDKVRLFHRKLKSLSNRRKFIITSDYYEEFSRKFLADRQLNQIYYNWVSSGYDKWKEPSLDHIIPLSKGGDNSIENLQWLTFIENQIKGSFMPDDWEKVKSNLWEYLV